MKNPDESFKAQVWDEHFSRDELRDLHYAYRRFYWRPSFVVRNLFQIRNVADLRRKTQYRVRLLVSNQDMDYKNKFTINDRYARRDKDMSHPDVPQKIFMLFDDHLFGRERRNTIHIFCLATRWFSNGYHFTKLGTKSLHATDEELILLSILWKVKTRFNRLGFYVFFVSNCFGSNQTYQRTFSNIPIIWARN